MKIKTNKIVRYSTTAILAGGLCMMLQNDRPLIAAQENVQNKEDQIKQLNKKLESEKEEVKKIQLKKNELIEALALLENKEKNLSTLIQENSNQKTELIATSDRLAEKKRNLSEKLAGIKEKIQQKQSFIEEKKKLLEKYETELSNYKKNPDMGLSEHEKLELEQLRANKASEEKKLKETKELKSEELKTIKSQEANIREYEESLLELKKNPEENSNRIFTVNGQIKMAKDILTKAQRTVAARDRSISRSEGKIKEYQQKITAIQSKVDSTDSTVDLQKRIRDVKQDIDKYELDKTDLMSQMESISKDIDQLTVQQKSINLKSIDDKIQALQQEHVGVLKEMEENKSAQQDIKNKESRLNSEIGNLQSKIDELNKEPKRDDQKDKNDDDNKDKNDQNHQSHQSHEDDTQEVVKLPSSKNIRIIISSITADESVKNTSKEPAVINKSEKDQIVGPVIKFKKGIFLIKLGDKWTKVKPKSLPKYLDNKLYKVKLTTKVKSKLRKVNLVDSKGKKTKHTIKRSRKVDVKGIRIINKHIYMYIGNGKYISINKVKL